METNRKIQNFDFHLTLLSLQHIENDKVKVIHVPSYDSLTMVKVLEYVKENEEALQYLPDPKDILLLPREYLMNLLHSVYGASFKQWVDVRCNVRNKKLKEKAGQILSVTEKFAGSIAGSTHVSSKLRD